MLLISQNSKVGLTLLGLFILFAIVIPVLREIMVNRAWRRQFDREQAAQAKECKRKRRRELQRFNLHRVPEQAGRPVREQSAVVKNKLLLGLKDMAEAEKRNYSAHLTLNELRDVMGIPRRPYLSLYRLKLEWLKCASCSND